MLTTVLSRLRAVNVFGSPLTVNNEYELKNERIATCLFIVIMALAVLTIFSYTAQMSITQTIEVKNPSYDRFQLLSREYPQTLHCPCDHIATPYESFVNIEPRFHQLCSSDFIKQTWIDHISSAAGTYVSDDFSYTAGLAFLTLASFCRQANETITNALQTFKSTHFITSEALATNMFENQIDANIQSFYLSTELVFYQSFNLVQFSIQTNTYTSGLFSNIIINFDMMNGLTTSHRLYENDTCDCDYTSSCAAPLTLNDRRTNQTNSSSYFTIPGLLKGCYLVEATRQSSLECFYQASCTAMIEQFLQAPRTLNNSITPLNATATSQFSTTSTVDQLLSKAMTEQWVRNVSHIQYFLQCQVSSCTYSFASRFNIIYIITTVIAIIGGLTKFLRFVIPRVVKFIRHRFVPPPPIASNAAG